MKKIYTHLTMLAMLAMTATMLTSCNWWDEDREIAYTLEGTWEGNMRIKSTYSGRTYYATETEITFSNVRTMKVKDVLTSKKRTV